MDLGLRADGERADPQLQLHALSFEVVVGADLLDLDERVPRPSQQTKHARRVYAAQPRLGDKIFITQPERRALGDRVILQIRLDIVSERVEALRRGPVAFVFVFKVDELGLFPVHSPRKPVRELVDAFPPLVFVSAHDASVGRDVEPQNERPVHLQLTLEEVFREVVPERRGELFRHRVQDIGHIARDLQHRTAAAAPDLAEEKHRIRLPFS